MTEHLTPEMLAELVAIVDAATPGPWRPVEGDLEGRPASEYVRSLLARREEDGTSTGRLFLTLAPNPIDPEVGSEIVPALTGDGPQSKANAEFVATFNPSLVRTLLGALAAEKARADRLTHLLGSHADGHRCTCECTSPGNHIEPPEYEQDPWCPTHPDVDYIRQEYDREKAAHEEAEQDNREWEDWSNELAILVPEEYEDDIAQEAIIQKALSDLVRRTESAEARADKAEQSVARARAVLDDYARIDAVVQRSSLGTTGPTIRQRILAALDGEGPERVTPQ